MAEEIKFEKLYSVEEVADILRISIRAVRKHLRDGKLIGTKIGKYYRIKESNVMKLIENGNCK